MKIGILTVPFNNNYGGYLQSFALMAVLKQMGHEPTIIMRRHLKHEVSISVKVKYFLRSFAITFIHRKYQSPFYSVENNFRSRGKEMHSFVNKYIQPQTKFLYTTRELRKYGYKKFDAYIVGSDQVWRAKYVPGIVGNMFLDFTEGWDVKRIAYAASFGTNQPEYTEQEIRQCGKYIEKFDAVSVREDSGLKVFNDFGWNVKNPQIVLDPTLLLSKEDYNNLLPNINNQVEGKIFCYVLDKNNESLRTIERVKNQIKRPVFEIMDIQNGDTVLPSIETWLTAIRDAHFVITDSFHGMVFSIIFEKPFVVITNAIRGADRFQSFLHSLGLENHIYKDNTDINVLFDTNWASVNQSICKKVYESKSFINKILNT